MITQEKKQNKKPYVLVRTYSAGVFAGILEKKDGKVVELSDARRIWYWEGAASLSELAVKGTTKPEKCKFPTPISVVLTEAIEIIQTTPEAEKSIREVPIWTAQ